MGGPKRQWELSASAFLRLMRILSQESAFFFIDSASTCTWLLQKRASDRELPEPLRVYFLIQQKEKCRFQMTGIGFHRQGGCPGEAAPSTERPSLPGPKPGHWQAAERVPGQAEAYPT
jgi:hypothetical protein